MNLAKHGVGFAEAASVFFDPELMMARDQSHSAKESRYIIFGAITVGPNYFCRIHI
jgi:uncharacterized DUF497 family protein